LIDCGLAKLQTVPSTPDKRPNYSLATHTFGKTEAIKGTDGYLCPRYRAGHGYTIDCEVYSFGVVIFEIITGSLQDSVDLTMKNKTVQDLITNADELAGSGWDKVLCRLAELALSCVSCKEREKRPHFGEISNKLSLIQMHMTGVIDKDPDTYCEENLENEVMHSCSVCTKSCDKHTCIRCRNGHILDSNCCRAEIIRFCCSASRADRFSCPLCMDHISIQKLVRIIPLEYITLLQKRYDEFDNLIDKIKILESRQSSFEEKQVDLETDINGMKSNIFKLDEDMSKINNQLVAVWKHLTTIAIEQQPCPKYVVILPAENVTKSTHSWLRDLFIKKMTFYFVCEHPRELVKAFDLIIPKSWAIKVAPWVKISLQVLIKSGTFGFLDLSLVSDIAGCFSSLVEQHYSKINQMMNALLIKGGRLGQKVLFDDVTKEQGILHMLRDSYAALVEEAEKHQGWKDELVSIVTPEHGYIWVKRGYENSI